MVTKHYRLDITQKKNHIYSYILHRNPRNRGEMEEIAGYIVGHAERDVACLELSWLVGIKSVSNQPNIENQSAKVKTYRGVPTNHRPVG
ncbi:hypothetical protein L208DRAFT_880943 [Tricholoma matsutake]|nr:hypothetical protein L208DRAFT_880943 [Tricholoma matsutake 945]